MKKHSTLILTAIMVLVLFFTACQKQPALKVIAPNLPVQPYAYKTAKYQNLSNGGDNTPSTNTMTNDGATLGRLLFYDPRLSINNAVACASCHKQQFAFADDQALSTGFQGQMTLRNTPAIINAVNKSVFFWDGRVNSLETQTLMPVKNHVEMGLERTDILEKKLSQISYYPQYFQNAFGTPDITSDRISMALAQFVRSIASTTDDFAPMNGDALAGRDLFFGKFRCSNCHVGENFGGASIFFPYYPVTHAPTSVGNTSNIGLDVSYKDQGVQALNGDPNQNGYFIIPSLRNVSLTAPYMHDGRFKTLDEVLNHYSTGIQSHPNLDPILIDQNFAANTVIVKTGNPVRMNMTDAEKIQLKAFLNTLTDNSITNDPRFSNPFK